MKISELWLREWADAPKTGTELAAQLTMAGLEVDSVYPVAGDFTGVVVAQVVDTIPHPQADKLTLCDVDVGIEHPIKIVCGAANVRVGLKVALAQLGAVLPGGFKIKEAKLRGEVSLGMLCSSSELGLEDKSEGILELPQDAPIGVDLRKYMFLDDLVLDVDLTPNRADCFSVFGVAREVAAKNALTAPVLPSTISQPQIEDTISVKLNAIEACPQYYCRVIRNIKLNAETPLWMSERLRRSGIRLRHPVVDVTNYVMLELGQPMHAFDHQLMDESIVVRFAKKDEELVLLDGKKITLDAQTLLIADTKKPLALAGVMGGADSAVNEETSDIVLESAFFTPLKIAGVARKYGLSTDSSQRFERGVDPQLQQLALERATVLLLEIVGGQAGPLVVARDEQHLPQMQRIQFDPAKVMQLTGVEIAPTQMLLFLKALGMVVDTEKQLWDVSVPSFRFDITIDVDLVEEIIRLYGYDKLNVQPMIASIRTGESNPRNDLSRKAADFFMNRGYNETINYSFVDPNIQEAIYSDPQVMRLLNPISPELSVMRTGLWPGLLAAMIYNEHRQQSMMRFFEQGVAFVVNDGQLKERSCIAGLISGETGELNWTDVTRKLDFYDVKGDLQSLLSQLGWHDPQFEAGEHPGLHPGKTARILIQGRFAGWVGVLHPRLAEALNITDDVMLFELFVDALLACPQATYSKISKYPQIRRDLALLVDNDISVTMIEQAVSSVVADDWLKSFDVFDVYTGDSIPSGKKSVAIALTLQDNNRTLVDEEINVIIDAILKKLKDGFAISLRD